MSDVRKKPTYGLPGIVEQTLGRELYARMNREVSPLYRIIILPLIQLPTSEHRGTVAKKALSDVEDITRNDLHLNPTGSSATLEEIQFRALYLADASEMSDSEMRVMRAVFTLIIAEAKRRESGDTSADRSLYLNLVVCFSRLYGGFSDWG